MTTMFDPLKRRPVDKLAAVVVGRGTRYVPFGPDEVAHIFHQETCPPLVPRSQLHRGMPDLTGRQCGRLTVIGMARDIKGCGHTAGRWVVRCACGDYEVRTAKAIKNPRNTDDMCRKCQQPEHTRRWRAWLDGLPPEERFPSKPNTP